MGFGVRQCSAAFTHCIAFTRSSEVPNRRDRNPKSQVPNPNDQTQRRSEDAPKPAQTFRTKCFWIAMRPRIAFAQCIANHTLQRNTNNCEIEIPNPWFQSQANLNDQTKATRGRVALPKLREIPPKRIRILHEALSESGGAPPLSAHCIAITLLERNPKNRRDRCRRTPKDTASHHDTAIDAQDLARDVSCFR
jgi:hypothetical protein